MAKFIVKHLDNGEVVEIHTIEANTLRGAKTIATKLVGWFVMGRGNSNPHEREFSRC